MYSRRPAVLVLGLCLLFVLAAGCGQVSDKDVVGKWTNVKSPHIWMEFYADKTSTGGKWSIESDGAIKVVNADGTILAMKIKEDKLIIEEFGEYGVYVKESK